MRVEQVANNVFKLIIGTILGVVGTILFLATCAALVVAMIAIITI